MNEISVSSIAEMSIDDRINFIADIWDSIAIFPEKVQIPEWHKAELEKRLKTYHENPNEGTPWLEVKKRIL
jgi:putative addiction module component (TIGR02574 family)